MMNVGAPCDRVLFSGFRRSSRVSGVLDEAVLLLQELPEAFSPLNVVGNHFPSVIHNQ